MSCALESLSPAIVDCLAELTRHRDREQLDVTLASAFRALFNPRAVAVYRKVGDAGQERWMTRARLSSRDAAPAADPMWTPLNSLPHLREYPARCEALAGRIVNAARAGGYVAVFPLATDREIVGVLEMQTDTELGAHAERIVCSILSVYRNFEGLLEYSERDTLTGLLNRKTFDETFLKIITRGANAASVAHARRAIHPDPPHWLGLIDIDFFKSVNDRYGHLIGDEVLILQSRLMRSTFRYEDRLYRFGGEEFVALIRCPTESDAARVFERLRLNTANYAFPQVGQVTISVGFTRVRPGDSPSSALGRADQCVYFAKAHGRNQVRGFDALRASGALAEALQPVGDVDLF